MKKIIFLIIILFMNLSFASAQVEVFSNTRITPPNYIMDNLWKGTSNPFNADGTYVLLNEYIGSNWVHPDFVSEGAGRGVVVGNVASLLSCSSSYGDGAHDAEWIDCYQAATSPLNNDFLSVTCSYTYLSRDVGCLNRWFSQYVRWSPIAGEENILYGIYLKSSGSAPYFYKIVKVNVATGTVTYVADFQTEYNSYYTTNGYYMDAYLLGWRTSDNTLIFNYGNPNSSSGYRNMAYDGFFLNVSTGAKEYYYNGYSTCTTNGWNLTYYGHVHQARSPDKSFIANYHGYDNGVIDNTADSNCLVAEGGGSGEDFYQHDWQDRNIVDIPLSSQISHVSWGGSNDWFVGADVGQPNPNSKRAPHIAEHNLYQIAFDDAYALANCPTQNTPCVGAFTHTLLLNMTGAGMWDFGVVGTSEKNYGGLMSPVIDVDGDRILIQSSGGKYSKTDYDCCHGSCPSTPSDAAAVAATCTSVDSNWGTTGIYFVSLVPTCTSWTYNAWGSCEPGNTQSRTVATSSPSGCSGGDPVLTQSCPYGGGEQDDADMSQALTAVTSATVIPKGYPLQLSYALDKIGEVVTAVIKYDDGTDFTGTNTEHTGLAETAGTTLTIDTSSMQGDYYFYVESTSGTGTNKAYLKTGDAPIKYSISGCTTGSGTICIGTLTIQ